MSEAKQEMVSRDDGQQLAHSASDSASLMSVISKAASDPQADVEKMERLMAMYERMEAKKAEAAFHAAMTQAQREMGRVSADATNPQTRSKYATYAALDRALRPIYTEHGFSLSFDTGDDAPEQYVKVLCYVSHEAGHSRTYHVLMPADGMGAKGNAVMTKTHAAGSAMSYGMRYLLKLIFNVAVGEDDDDGNRADIARITEDQIANLESLISEVGANQTAFQKYLGIVKLDDLAASRYSDAVKALEAKRRKG